MSINSNLAKICMAIVTWIPETASEINVPKKPTEVTMPMNFDSASSGNRDRNSDIVDLSAEETFLKKSFPNFDALVEYIKQEEQINFASLHTIIDYVIKNRNEDGPLQYYSGYNHDSLLQQIFNTNVARSNAEFKDDGINASQLASKISQLFEPEEPEDTFASLSINQKAAVTAILAQSKGGEIDDEFLCAIERLKDIPLKS